MPPSNILLIEDDKAWQGVLQTLICEALSNINQEYHIILAQNHTQALEYLKSDTAWGLICANNLSFASEIQETGSVAITHGIPIIFVTQSESCAPNEFSKNSFDLGKFKQFIEKHLSPKLTTVFLCYCHRDVRFMERFEVHIKPQTYRSNIDVWVDTKIRGGQDWRSEIEKALKRAKIAVLLISADFLASDFITKYELPTLLDKAKTDGTVILSVYLSHCYHDPFKLSRFQFINPLDQPLSGLNKHRKEHYWTDLTRRIRELASETDIILNG